MTHRSTVAITLTRKKCSKNSSGKLAQQIRGSYFVANSENLGLMVEKTLRLSDLIYD